MEKLIHYIFKSNSIKALIAVLVLISLTLTVIVMIHNNKINSLQTKAFKVISSKGIKVQKVDDLNLNIKNNNRTIGHLKFNKSGLSLFAKKINSKDAMIIYKTIEIIMQYINPRKKQALKEKFNLNYVDAILLENREILHFGSGDFQELPTDSITIDGYNYKIKSYYESRNYNLINIIFSVSK